MHAALNVVELRSALNKILSVVDKKGPKSILGHALLEVEKEAHLNEGRILLSATDLDISAKVSVPAIVENPGRCCVNAKNLFDIVKELPDGRIILQLNSDEQSLKIDLDDIHFSLLIYNNDDFPPLHFGNTLSEFKLKASQVLEIISKTGHAISNDETRLFLNGLFLQEVDSKLRAVATDGHRLSLIETELPDGTLQLEALVNGIIIPRKGINEWKKLAESIVSEGKSDLLLSMDEAFLYLSADDSYFLSIRLISREYPRYQAVIPSKTTYSLVIDRDSFLESIRRIKIMASERSNGIRMLLRENELELMANHSSLGDAREKMLVDYVGKEMDIGFNAKYLIDAFNTLDEGDVRIELNNELSPVVIKSETLPHYLGLVMPLKI